MDNPVIIDKIVKFDEVININYTHQVQGDTEIITISGTPESSDSS